MKKRKIKSVIIFIAVTAAILVLWNVISNGTNDEAEFDNRYEAFLAEIQPSEAACAADRRYGGMVFTERELSEVPANMLK